MKKWKNGGFTLIELMLVISLISIVSVVAVPAFKRMSLGFKLSNDMQTLKFVLNRARLESMKLGVFTSVTLSSDTGGNATVTAFIDTNKDGIQDSGETVIEKGEFHDTTIMDGTSFATELNGGLSTQFNPLGFPFGLVSGIITKYSGTIDAHCLLDPDTAIYQRVTIGTGGNITIQKQSTPFS